MKTKRTAGAPRPTGRPPKFAEPSRPVTVTLPERTVAALRAIEPDLARAIVRVADAACAGAEPRGLEIVEVTPGRGLIVVGACRRLARIPWLRLAEIAPGRHLVTIDPGTPIEQLEVALADLLDDTPAGEAAERKLLEELRDAVRQRRRSGGISKAELLYLDVRPGPRAARAAAAGERRRGPARRRPLGG